MQNIQLFHGNGGLENSNLINDVFMKYFRNFCDFALEDAGIFNATGKFAASTDGFSISPIFFKGGDIGKLSICGSCNDIAVMGAKPRYLTLSFMLEEGLLISDLEKIIQSIASELKKADLKILSADTKVVPKGALDSIFITATAFGEIYYPNLSAKNLKKDNVIILSAPIGAHGASLYCLRNEIKLENNLSSDCANCFFMIESVLKSGAKINAIRDATRGGIASVLNEWANASACDILLDESEILVLDSVRGVCEILGLEPFVLANEGVCVFAVDEDSAQSVLKTLQSTDLGKNAKIIGKVESISSHAPRVILKNAWGATRYLDYPQGEILPRIC